MTKQLPVLEAGTKAYIDSFAGLIPCVVLAIRERELYGCEATVKVTAARPGYQRGEEVTRASFFFIPRECVKVRNHKYVVRGTWVTKVTPGN